MARVGIIGDPHEPATHPMYRRWIGDLFDLLKIDTPLCIGDMADFHNISFHPREVAAQGVNEELELTKQRLAKWYQQYPDLKICIGNHDARLYRKAASVSMPASTVRTYNEVWATPGWEWADDFHIDGVHYFHGTNHSGARPAYNIALRTMQSTVIGHTHSNAGVGWLASPVTRIFAMDVGCGVDVRHPAMLYGQSQSHKPLLAAGAVLDGLPLHFMMPCMRGEPYHRSRASKKERR